MCDHITYGDLKLAGPLTADRTLSRTTLSLALGGALRVRYRCQCESKQRGFGMVEPNEGIGNL